MNEILICGTGDICVHIPAYLNLECARASRLGEMTEEYCLGLILAMEVTGCITDQPRRRRVEEALRGLIAQMDPGKRSNDGAV